MHETKVNSRLQDAQDRTVGESDNADQSIVVKRPAGASEIDRSGTEQGVVFVVDDSADVRNGTKQLIESVGLRCEVFTSPQEFLQRSRANSPSCLILDVRLREINGLDLLAQMGKAFPTVVITGYGDIPMAVRAMQAGAINFLTKPLREQDLLEAIYAGLAQHRAQLEQEEKRAGLHARVERLSPREREILLLVTAGLLNKQIATEVGLSEVTVKVHRHKLMAKLNAKSVPDLVRIADAFRMRKNGSGPGKNGTSEGLGTKW